MEAFYKCRKFGCRYPGCDKLMMVSDRVILDRDRNPLYTAICQRTGEVVDGIHESELIRQSKQQTSTDSNSAMVDDNCVKAASQGATSNTESAVKSKVEYAQIMRKLDTIEGYVRPKGIDTQGVVALIRDVRTADIDGVTSLDKAVDYIRHCKPEDERFYARSVAARQFVESIAKAEAGGIDKRWATLAQYAKTSDAEQRRKAKGKGKPHANAIPQGW